MATTSFEKLTVHWRELLFSFVQRQDQTQKLKPWCEDNDIAYGTARAYFSPSNIKSAIAYIATLQESAKNPEDDLSDCSIAELMEAFEVARTGKKRKKPESIYLEVLPEQEKEAFQRIWDSGMDLRGEIALIRFQIYRAKKAQTAQEKAIEDGKPDESLSLVEKKEGTVTIDGTDCPTSENKYTLGDWDTVIQRLGQLLSSLMSLQVKIEFGERLTADEQADIISRVTKMVDSDTMTAVQGSMALSSAGVKNIPLPLDLKMREELSLMGDVYGDRVGDPQDKIEEEIARRKAERDEITSEFLAKREAELTKLNADDEK